MHQAHRLLDRVTRPFSLQAASEAVIIQPEDLYLATYHSNMKAFLSIDFALLATLGLLSLAGSNRAADTDSQRGALKSDAQLWAENCILCHEIKPRVSFTSAKLDSITRHMREEADLSPEEQEAIL